MIVQFRNEKVSNHGSIPIPIDCNVVAFIVFEEGFHQPIKRTKHFHAEIVEMEIGGVAIYRSFGKFRRAKSYRQLYGAQGQRQAYL
ncbi:hypothetical protein TNCV_5024301 [Trichonephila clavipes]|nr:hypothetical protein TNCV_5024301 [Trichonephila clavipes]